MLKEEYYELYDYYYDIFSDFWSLLPTIMDLGKFWGKFM